MLDSDVRVLIKITCDKCGESFKKELEFNTMDTDLISIHNLEDEYMDEQGYSISNNIVSCKDCAGTNN